MTLGSVMAVVRVPSMSWSIPLKAEVSFLFLSASLMDFSARPSLEKSAVSLVSSAMADIALVMFTGVICFENRPV